MWALSVDERIRVNITSLAMYRNCNYLLYTSVIESTKQTTDISDLTIIKVIIVNELCERPHS